MKPGAGQIGMFPLVSLRAASDDEVNELLVGWEHPLGACRRPFGQQGFVFEVERTPVGCAMSASTVSDTIRMDDGRVFGRGELVELARIGRAPGHRWVLRVLVRLWRECLAPLWSVYWPPLAAVSYAMPGTMGDIYRFDGWQLGGIRRPSGGSGTWTRADPAVNRIGDGKKRLWLWPYEAAQEPSPTEARRRRGSRRTGSSMRGQAGTRCTLTISWWDGERPVEGDFLRTEAGSCYRIDEVHPRRLVCTRLERDAVQFGEPGVWAWSWKPRRKATA